MTITEIKQHLSIKEVLEHYQIRPKNGMINSPFHEDRTPSMQVFEDSDTVRCYSGNCPQSNKVIDVIDFIMYKEDLSKHESLLKDKEMTDNDLGITKNHQSPMVNLQLSEERILFLESLYKSFRKGVYNCVPAKEYLAQRNLDPRQIEVGYNSGQFHHGEQKTRSLYTAP